MMTQILVGLVALMVLVLLVPFHARARGWLHGGSAAGAVDIRWGAGLLALRLSSEDGLTARLLGVPLPPIRFRSGRPRSRSRDRRARGRKAGKTPQDGKRPGAAALLRHRGDLLHMALQLARPLRLRLRLAGIVGTGDPAEVALLAGIGRAAGGRPGVTLDLEWDWVEEVLELEGELSARIWVAHLLGVAAALWLRPENRVALRAVRG